ncbi:hypothetical protein HYPSUDRAFT_205741 [Hypholoma sublateritium FD-334 SS-4]|uniref:Uncharacterized protein n=1 Tax=Hypholoma sublateritium (strain FD-334 SS-4) TaxID=945553 RepID=A0A0D2KTQ2_HYPSF|nr:hypothetical protein HYPSUDRAFT_205741 [Hypholoma sublateritium FD-334 SS-4]
MACAQIKGHLKRLPADQVIRLAALIRCPTNDTPAGRLIISDIIPAVAKLRAQFNIKFTTMFAYTVLLDFKQPLTIMSDNIVASDGFFDSIAFDSFIKPRDWEKWASCRSLLPILPLESGRHFTAIDHTISRNLLLASVWPIAPDTPIQHSASIMSSPTRIGSDYSIPSSPLTELDDNDDEGEDRTAPALVDDSQVQRYIFTINTHFNPSANQVAPISNRNTDQEVFDVTEEVRRLASEFAVTPKDMADLKEKLKWQLQTGRRTSAGKFIRITSQLLQGKPLRINDMNGNMLLIVDPTLPAETRSALIDRMLLVFDEDFKIVKTAEEGFNNMFPSMHYSHYNCFSVQGDDADDTREPVTYQKPGLKRKINTSQFLPRASKEMQTTPKQFQLLHSSYEDMFQWQSSELKDFLPNVYKDLATYVDQLPGNDTNPAYPFAGFVLNLNVSTRLHRDRHDKDICLIVSF